MQDGVTDDDRRREEDLALFEPAPVIDVKALPLKKRQTWDKQEVFLVAIVEYGTIRQAAAAAGISRRPLLW